ncbi:MAG: diaminopimelate epimerase [Steroidobacteraceae bacterium]|jgi:diaminopimelate epimerase|nr:diaminopimelate epimerase [Steroidobacteraceae bacterium]
MGTLAFTKMHGAGNDVIVFEESALPCGLPSRAQWRRLSDRRTGIGFDQAMVIFRPRQPGTDVFYRIFNADGGEVEQCGNGARCVAEWLRLQGRARDGALAMDSPAGVVAARLESPGQVSVDMGAPRFEPESLPFVPDAGATAIAAHGGAQTYAIEIAGRRTEFAIASMGNPHAVLFVDDVATAPVAEIGAALQRHPCFPKSVNVGFLQVIDPAHAKLRVFERGVGETLACGTGACAAVAVGRKAGRLAGDVEVALPGGALHIRWGGRGEPVWMSGPAEVAFRGEVEL